MATNQIANARHAGGIIRFQGAVAAGIFAGAYGLGTVTRSALGLYVVQLLEPLVSSVNPPDPIEGIVHVTVASGPLGSTVQAGIIGGGPDAGNLSVQVIGADNLGSDAVIDVAISVERVPYEAE